VKLLNALDLAKNEIQNAVAQNLASAPSSPIRGQFYMDTSTTPGILYWYDGSGWQSAKAGLPAAGSITDSMLAGSISNSKLLTNPLDRANHTGTQTASTISNFASTVQGYSLDLFTAPAANLSMASHKVTNVTDPTSAQDAATKAYVDAFSQGFSFKASVRVATTATGTLTTAYENGDVIDGVTLATGDRILIKDQSTASENGIYTVNASGAPTRATDADASGEIAKGTVVYVQSGTANATQQWAVTATGATPWVPGSSTSTWSQVSQPSATSAGAGLTGTSNVYAVGAGTGITVAADSVAVDHTVVPYLYAVDVGDGSSTTITVTHNLGTKDVMVQVYDKTTPFATVWPDVNRNGTNTVQLVFATAPTSAQYRCVVHG
jgi:hypothetical protein